MMHVQNVILHSTGDPNKNLFKILTRPLVSGPNRSGPPFGLYQRPDHSLLEPLMGSLLGPTARHGRIPCVQFKTQTKFMLKIFLITELEPLNFSSRALGRISYPFNDLAGSKDLLARMDTSLNEKIFKLNI